MQLVYMYGYAHVHIHTTLCKCIHAFVHSYAGQAYTPVTEEVSWWKPEAYTSASSFKSLYEAQILKSTLCAYLIHIGNVLGH
jgi:hypothetical protein